MGAETFDPALTRPDISNRVVKGFLPYFQERFGERFVADVVEGAGLSIAYLDDTEKWVSAGFVDRFTAEVAHRLYKLETLPAYDHPLWQHWREAGWINLRPSSSIGPASTRHSIPLPSASTGSPSASGASQAGWSPSARSVQVPSRARSDL